jgi:agmatine deiminase
MPDEGSPHRRTWMAFGAGVEIWGSSLTPIVQRDLARIALAIAAFEPVSMLVRPSERAVARDLMGTDVDLLEAPLDDLWIRDTGPVFVDDGHAQAAVDFHFNGWGNRQQHAQDAEVAGFVARAASTPLISSTLTLEGGALEVDGEGTAIITESCVLNDNRNPGVSRRDVEAELARTLGIDHVIWLPGIAGKDITDAHTDFYARFARPGVVVATLETDPTSYDYRVTRRHLDILHSSVDAAGRPLEIHVLPGPVTVRPLDAPPEFAAGYVNYYVCNGGVIAPNFGDVRADQEARDLLQALYPGREVVTLDIDGIAAGGGGIHCATQQQPQPPDR